MDRFVNRQNIERFRRLTSEATDAAERLQIMRLLAEKAPSSGWIRPWAIATTLGNPKQGTNSPKADKWPAGAASLNPPSMAERSGERC